MTGRRRARNPDGSLVKPLSEAQLAALDKGRRALAARLTEPPAPARTTKAKPGPAKEKRGGRVQHVTVGGTKAKPRATKPTATTNPAKETGRRDKGALERFADWLTST